MTLSTISPFRGDPFAEEQVKEMELDAILSHNFHLIVEDREKMKIIERHFSEENPTDVHLCSTMYSPLVFIATDNIDEAVMLKFKLGTF